MAWIKNNLYLRVIINLFIQITGLNLFTNLITTGNLKYVLKFVIQYFVVRTLLTLNFMMFGWFILIHSYILSFIIFPFIIFYTIKLILKMNSRFDKEKIFILKKDK